MPQPGLFGRKPFNPETPHLVLEKYLHPRMKLSRAGLPPVAGTALVDRSSKVLEIPMYLNQVLGDCTIAGEAHLLGAQSVYAGRDEVLFDDAEIQKAYSRVGGYVPGDPSTDNGCVMSDVLADLKATGLTDRNGLTHRAEGYARIGNPADEDLLAQCLDVFGSVYVGFSVQQHMLDQFTAGQVWTYRPGDTVVGGHCVVLQRRYPEGSMHGILEYWTWGSRQRADFGWQARVEEAWVVVTRDWLGANGTTVAGMDLPTLLADMADV